MIRTRRYSLALMTMIFFFGLLAALPAYGEVPVNTDARQVVVIGTAPIYKDDSANAREHAVADGLDAAVERAVADLLPLESLVGSFQTLNQTVFGSPDAFIQGFKVLAENVAGKQYRVIVQADISTPRIIEKLSQAGMAVGTQSLPTILVAVSEQGIDDLEPRYWWAQGPVAEVLPVQEAMAESLGAVGLPILDPFSMDTDAQTFAFSQPAELTLAAAVEMGQRAKADVVIMGSADVVAAENTMGDTIRSFRATVRVQAIRVVTGEIIAETEQKAVSAHGDAAVGSGQALSNAGLQAGRALSRQIVVAWRNQEKTTTDIEVVVDGTRDLGNLVMFRRSLKNTYGVREVLTKTMRPDQAILNVVYQGDAKALADLLVLNTFDRFHVNIHEVSSEHLGVRLYPNQD